VVAEILLAPAVVVLTGNRTQRRGREDVIEAPAAAVPGDPPPSPARLAGGVTVQGAEGVDVAELAQSRNDAELGRVPLGPAFGTEASMRVAGEGDRLAAGQLAARGIEIAAQHARTGGRRLQAGPDRLQRSHLYPAVGGIGDVHAIHLDGTQIGLGGGGHRRFRPRHHQRPADIGAWSARGDHHPHRRSVLAGAGPLTTAPSRAHVDKPEELKGARPQRLGPPGHLLQGDDVGLPSSQSGRLLGQPLCAPGDVPGDQSQAPRTLTSLTSERPKARPADQLRRTRDRFRAAAPERCSPSPRCARRDRRDAGPSASRWGRRR
jgi:hypothetical protein